MVVLMNVAIEKSPPPLSKPTDEKGLFIENGSSANGNHTVLKDSEKDWKLTQMNIDNGRQDTTLDYTPSETINRNSAMEINLRNKSVTDVTPIDIKGGNGTDVVDEQYSMKRNNANMEINLRNKGVADVTPTDKNGGGVVDEQYSGSVSKRKSFMNDKIAFSIRVQAQLFKIDFTLYNIPLFNYDEFETLYLAEGFFGTTYKVQYFPVPFYFKYLVHLSAVKGRS